MRTIILADTYAGNGSDETPYHPAVLDKVNWMALTDQPTALDMMQIIPSPNVLVVQIACDDATLAAIEAHPDYGPGAILYDIPNPYPGDGKPDANEYGQRRSYCARLGIKQAQFSAMFGTQANPKARKTGADNLITWVKTLPKGR